MENVREQILSYPQRSAEEQRRVEKYVEAHPEWAPLFRDIRRLESFLRKAGGDDPILTSYVVAQEVEMEGLSSTFEEAFGRIERALDEDEELRAQIDEMQEQFEQAEADLNPVSHFESVTGHSLSDREDGSASLGEPSRDNPDAPPQASGSRGAQGGAALLLSLPPIVQRIGSGLLGLLAVYLGLFAIDQATQSTFDRLATIEVSDQMVESYYSSQTQRTVSGPDTTTVDDVYLGSLATLRQAESTTFGLFREYHRDSLRHAKRGLERVLNRTEPSSFLASEARFYLGKLCLAEKRIEKARAHFEAVVQQDGRRAPEAQRILKSLEETSEERESDAQS